MSAAFTPGPFATNADVEAAIAQNREWQTRAAPTTRYQPRVLAGDCTHAVSRRPFKRNGYWSIRNAGTARLLRPIDCETTPGWPPILVFPTFYGRVEADANAILAKIGGDA